MALTFLVFSSVLLASAIVARARAGRLPRSPVVQFAPLAGASVIDDAILAGRERRAIAAGIIDLVVRRRIRLLTESGTARAGFALQIIDAQNLTDHDRRVLDLVSGACTPSGSSRRISSHRRETARRIRGFIDARARALRTDGLVSGRRRARSVIRWVAALLALVVGIFLTTPPTPAPFAVTLSSAVLLTATLMVVPPGRSRRFTPAARSRREHLDGIRRYLLVAEAERLRILQSPTASLQPAGDAVQRFALHKRLLPYAVIFGIEKQWLATLGLEFDERGETSGDVLGQVADGFFQGVDADAFVDGVLNIAVGADHLLDAVGAVIDGLL